MTVSASAMPPLAPRFGHAPTPRFGADGPAGKLEIPGLIIASAGMKGDESESELLAGKLFTASKNAILKPEQAELNALPLSDKTALIRGFANAVALADEEAPGLVKKDGTAPLLLERLYKALMQDLPGLGQSAVVIQREMQKLSPQAKGHLAESLHALAALYPGLNVPYPTQLSNGLAGFDQSLTDLMEGGLSLMEATGLKRSIKEASDLQQFVGPLHEALKKDVYGLNDSSSAADVDALTDGMRHIRKAAATLKVDLSAGGPLAGLDLKA